jgi:hypothetical protein
MLTKIQKVIIPATVGATLFTHYMVVDAKLSLPLAQSEL